MVKRNALIEHDQKIKDARELIRSTTGFTRRDAQKHLKRLLRERAEYIRLTNTQKGRAYADRKKAEAAKARR